MGFSWLFNRGHKNSGDYMSFFQGRLKGGQHILGQAQSHDSDTSVGRGSNTGVHGLDPPPSTTAPTLDLDGVDVVSC